MNPASCKISRAWLKDWCSLVLRLEGERLIVRVVPFESAYEVVECSEPAVGGQKLRGMPALQSWDETTVTLRLDDLNDVVVSHGPGRLRKERLECFEDADDDDD